MSTPPPILPPFDKESAQRKVQLAQDAWNTRDPTSSSKVATPSARSCSASGRASINDYPITEDERRIAVDPA